jgi:hypothetical protein
MNEPVEKPRQPGSRNLSAGDDAGQNGCWACHHHLDSGNGEQDANER